jgi:threonine aldolase
VRFKVTSIPAPEFAERLYARGIRVLPAGADGVRAIPYLNISREQILEAVEIVRSVLSGDDVEQDVVQKVRSSAI